ncbi:hypothetical protein [Nocardioides perillae]|uniref:Uncharacterized protein n=1 Tax=Nocardioides perillae TaxID=1119534 RepID=A0A7Y9RP61_9ACTN|nr:hypothetical protein [Nocardioides perillae]NYG53770.1 hypothetical protein [Nocardioides perillae]
MLKFLLVVAVVGVAIYLLVRVIERRGVRRRGDGGAGGRPAPRRPLGPDDDPEFLWNLDKRKRHPKRRPEDPDAGPGAGPGPAPAS